MKQKDSYKERGLTIERRSTEEGDSIEGGLTKEETIIKGADSFNIGRRTILHKLEEQYSSSSNF